MNSQWLTFVTDFFGPLTKTKWGTKALLAIACIAIVGYLTYIDKIDGSWCAGAIVTIFVAYSVFRGSQEKRDQEFATQTKEGKGTS